MTPVGMLPTWRLTRAKAVGAANPNGVHVVSDMAAACHLSRSYFRHAFKNTVGVAPRQWTRQLRIAAARRMLIETSIPLALVGLDCGFAHQAHFTRVFRQEVGMPPGEYRRAGTVN